MKIHADIPDTIKAAIKENLACEFTAATNADVILPPIALPARLGAILDIISSLSVNSLRINGLEIDFGKQLISAGDKQLSLTEKEAQLLQYLATAKAPVTRDDMLKQIWGYAADADTKTAENLIYRLRQKVTKTFGCEIIVTEGTKYKFIEI